jgi:hypothetical protein
VDAPFNLFKQLALFAAIAFCDLAIHLASATNSSGLFTGALFRGLFKMPAQFHFAIDAFALQLFLQGPQRLVNIIVANDDLHELPNSKLLGPNFSSAASNRLLWLKPAIFALKSKTPHCVERRIEAALIPAPQNIQAKMALLRLSLLFRAALAFMVHHNSEMQRG